MLVGLDKAVVTLDKHLSTLHMTLFLFFHRDLRETKTLTYRKYSYTGQTNATSGVQFLGVRVHFIFFFHFYLQGFNILL